jgi:ATP-dependent RNA helicase SUPV3L1/SUV3
VLMPEPVSPPCESTPLDAAKAAANELETNQAPQAQPDAIGAANSVEAAAAEEPLIEIWRPHRQQHPRRPPEARTRKKPFERRDRAPAAGVPATAPEAAAQEAPPRETVAGEPPDSAGAGIAALAQDQTASPPRTFKGRHKVSGERGEGEQKPRFGGHRGRKHAGEQNRPGVAEQGERRGERFGTREKRQSERPPDPDSPFAKLLVLKAQLEEKTRQAKDNQES